MEGVNVDYLIIGAGPAGLQMGYLLQKQGINYAILERGECAGTFFKTFPRHRKLISINKVYTGYDDPEINLRWDWNSLLSDDEGMLFKNYSRRYFPAADDLVRYLNDYALFYGLRILFNKKVTRVYRNARNGEFHVATADGDVYRARTLIVATGLACPFLPDIPGLKSVEVYTTVSVDPKDFENQRVLIIGKGNSAFETGDNLAETAAMIHLASPNPIKMAWATHFVGHLRAVNNNLLDTYQLKSQNATIDAAIREVRQRSDGYHVVFEYTHAEGEVEELVYDRVIACTGFRFNAEIFDASCRPRLTLCDRFPDQTPAWESVNVPDLYFAGTLMQMRDYKRYMSGFIHGFRYNIRTLSQFLAAKYESVPLPQHDLPVTVDKFAEAILTRVNRSSGVWQQPGYLCDVIEWDRHNHRAAYFEELPMDFVAELMQRDDRDYVLVSLEYGHSPVADPFNAARIARDSVERSDHSAFLHPVVRWYTGRSLASEHHVIEDLAAEWCEPEHTEPLRAFVAEQLVRGSDRRRGERAALS